MIFIILVVFCRFQVLKATKSLSTEDKAKLLDSSTRPGQYLLLFIIIIAVFLGVWFLNYEIKSITNFKVFVVIMWVILVILIGLGIWSRIAYFHRLKKAGLPKKYIQTVTCWHIVVYLALIVFMITLYNTKDIDDNGEEPRYSLSIES